MRNLNLREIYIINSIDINIYDAIGLNVSLSFFPIPPQPGYNSAAIVNRLGQTEGATSMDDLVHRLSQGKHRVEVRLRPERTVTAFKESIDRGVVHVRFPETRGGTELGVHLDRGLTDLTSADFANNKGHAHVVGNLVLNYVKVQCVADIELETLAGSGHLIPLLSEAVSPHN